MANKNVECQNTGMTLVITYFVFFVVNSLIIWLANMLFPAQVVLGTWYISGFWAIIHSMGTLALINTFTIPFVRDTEKKRDKMLSKNEWMVVCFLINVAGVWLIARKANQFGMGIKSWLVAVILGLVFGVVQTMAMMQVEKCRKKCC
ncbi:hypothetical protein KKA02_00270 [Patescibacteria group bacterium]|nr:hypothetical protein [Patescibacteria group bacterium]